MNSAVKKRAIMLGEYISENKVTVRAAAKIFKVSKSTVHKDITERLEIIDHRLFLKVRKVLQQNKDERHIRGGLATREKYALLKARAAMYQKTKS